MLMTAAIHSSNWNFGFLQWEALSSTRTCKAVFNCQPEFLGNHGFIKGKLLKEARQMTGQPAHIAQWVERDVPEERLGHFLS